MAHALREHSKKPSASVAHRAQPASIGGAVLQSTTGASSDTVNLGANILSEYGVNMPSRAAKNPKPTFWACA